VLDVQAIASADKKYITLTMRPTNAQVEAWRRFGPPVNSFPGGAVVDGGPAIAQSAVGSYPMLIPQIAYSAVRTSVTIPDGGSLVIAGMTNGISRRSHAGVPFLSHIPFLGRLFSSNGRSEIEYRQLIIVQADLVLFEEIEAKL
jgi:type II secretory pathway component GspD/PulD (secretin)